MELFVGVVGLSFSLLLSGRYNFQKGSMYYWILMLKLSAKGVVEHFIILLKIKLTLSNVCYTLGHQINCSNPRFTSHGFILAVRIMVQSIIVTRQRKTVMYLVECVGFYTFLIILIPIHGNWKKGLMSLIWYHLALLCLGMLA